FRALFALDSRLRGNGGYFPCQWVVFRADLDFRSFYTACFAGMMEGTYTAREWRDGNLFSSIA
ncbi:MAG: hypothetical protein OXU61_12375, partial [Gammaproteobacteria bacterium]|nr:hypothetical protein [Gammaproteobacteria bacterium]